MKFIKLTETTKNGPKIVLINFEHVASVGKGTRGDDTHIKMSDANYFFVKESIEDILDILYPVKSFDISDCPPSHVA